jgi:hypothetical protein
MTVSVPVAVESTSDLVTSHVSELPEETTSADVEVKVTYLPGPKTELVVHQETKKLTFK